tara:strand:- start:1981 stop:2235 length:255 start_codon:yes stop_codon:yes gene_type:complete
MALSKEITYDYEIRGIGKNIQERKKTTIVEDGTELSSAYHRRVLTIGDDLSSESDELKALSSSLWTPVVSASYAEQQASSSLSL